MSILIQINVPTFVKFYPDCLPPHWEYFLIIEQLTRSKSRAIYYQRVFSKSLCNILHFFFYHFSTKFCKPSHQIIHILIGIHNKSIYLVAIFISFWQIRLRRALKTLYCIFPNWIFLSLVKYFKHTLSYATTFRVLDNITYKKIPCLLSPFRCFIYGVA